MQEGGGDAAGDFHDAIVQQFGRIEAAVDQTHLLRLQAFDAAPDGSFAVADAPLDAVAAFLTAAVKRSCVDSMTLKVLMSTRPFSSNPATFALRRFSSR